jgi:hypothetical protein
MNLAKIRQLLQHEKAIAFGKFNFHFGNTFRAFMSYGN